MQLYDITGLPVEHRGIKGQRWGFRRYQNIDGTLTPEGKKRYNQASKNAVNRALTRGAARVYTAPQVARSSVKNAVASVLPPIGKLRTIKEEIWAEHRDLIDIREGIRTKHISAGRDFVDVEGATELHYRNKAASLLEYRKTKLDGLNRVIAGSEYDSKEYGRLVKERDTLMRDIERTEREAEAIREGEAKVHEIIVNLF
jgi:hypothetical protein